MLRVKNSFGKKTPFKYMCYKMSQKFDLVTKIKKNVCTQIKKLSLKIFTNNY